VRTAGDNHAAGERAASRMSITRHTQMQTSLSLGWMAETTTTELLREAEIALEKVSGLPLAARRCYRRPGMGLAHASCMAETGMDMTRLDRFDAFIDNFDSALEVRFRAQGEMLDERFASIDERFASIDARFAAIDARFAAVDARFAAVDARFIEVNQRLDRIDENVLSLRKDMTRVQQDVASLQENVTNLRKDVTALQTDMTIVKHGVAMILQKLG